MGEKVRNVCPLARTPPAHAYTTRASATAAQTFNIVCENLGCVGRILFE